MLVNCNSLTTFDNKTSVVIVSTEGCWDFTVYIVGIGGPCPFSRPFFGDFPTLCGKFYSK